VIEVVDLDFRYGDGPWVFRGFNWQVGRGEAWAILGPSGCGKSTLLYLAAGLRQSVGGQVRVAGEELLRPRPRTGLILQDFGLLPWATVHENAALGLRVRGFYGPDGTHAPTDEQPEALSARVDPWLARLGLTAVQHAFPGQISGGQRQRTAIARTLALNPDLLLMDEPFAALDAPTREGLQDLMLQLRDEQGLTSVLVTHSIEEAALMGERVLVLGNLPNRQANVDHEPAASMPEFRQQEAYVERVGRLRAMLEAV
jgi:ABC-type nitrate/sulfonate/bicarbonate transport system ATPase subunit